MTNAKKNAAEVTTNESELEAATREAKRAVNTLTQFFNCTDHGQGLTGGAPNSFNRFGGAQMKLLNGIAWSLSSYIEYVLLVQAPKLEDLATGAEKDGDIHAATRYAQRLENYFDSVDHINLILPHVIETHDEIAYKPFRYSSKLKGEDKADTAAAKKDIAAVKARRAAMLKAQAS